MSLFEGLPREAPMVVTSLVIALLLNVLNRSMMGSKPMRSRNVNFREKRRSSRFCQGYRNWPGGATRTDCVTCVSPGTMACVTLYVRDWGRPEFSRNDAANWILNGNVYVA